MMTTATAQAFAIDGELNTSTSSCQFSAIEVDNGRIL